MKRLWQRLYSLRVVVAATALAMAAALLANSPFIQRIDLLAYDVLARFGQPPDAGQVLIVAIDQPSLQELGRWPWSRSVHARLLDQLTAAGARAVAFDVLFTEQENDEPGADRQLSAALQRNAKTVLAIAPEQGAPGEAIRESLPLPELAASAAALGHVDIELDIDGLCRSVYLWAGLGGPHWPSLGLALKQVAENTDQAGREQALVAPAGQIASARGWVRSSRMLIPFPHSMRQIQRFSYVDVLKGRIPRHLLQERIVLIGSTATGLGDAVSTPVSPDYERMPGVEVNANITQSLLAGRMIRQAPPVWLTAATSLVVLAGFLLMGRVPMGYALSVLSLSLMVTILLVLTSLWLLHLWFPPSAALIGQLAAYPLWSGWRWATESETSMRLAQYAEHQARHQAITDLPNRLMLQEYLAQCLEQTDKDSAKLGIMIIRLEAAGMEPRRIAAGNADLFEKAVAHRLQQTLRQQDFLAQLGTDEFAVVMSDLADIQPVTNIGNRIVKSFLQPITENGTDLALNARAGACLFPDHGKTAHSLTRNAYTAMDKARERGAEPFCLFSERIQREINEKSLLEHELRHALQRGEFEVHYQPQIALSTEKLIGMEALLRWRNPQLGDISPTRFIPMAERTGLIVPIGQWVLEQACRQMQRWRGEGADGLRVAVNLSPVQIANADLVDTVESILEKTGLPAHCLELEVTENALMQDLEMTVAVLGALRQRGIQISIDDFGTGYSSLSYLKQFPLDRLKIDRSFVTELGDCTETNEITLAIISMAHKLNLQVIAEGVETKQQQVFLTASACDEMQGFLYSKPLPAEALEALFLAENDAERRSQPSPARRA